MRALTTVPLQAGTLAVVDVPDPVPLEDFAEAFEPRDDDVKVVLTLDGSTR